MNRLKSLRLVLISGAVLCAVYLAGGYIGEFLAVSGGNHQIREYQINKNTSQGAEITFRMFYTGFNNTTPSFRVLTAGEPVYIGERTAEDPTLGTHRVELMFRDTVLGDEVARKLGTDTKQLDGGGLIQSIRVAYPPDDSLMVVYLGCTVKPEVTLQRRFNRITLRLVPGT